MAKKGTIWKKSKYLRKRSNTWRDRNTDEVRAGSPTGKIIGYEPKNRNFYGSHPISKKRAEEVKKKKRRY